MVNHKLTLKKLRAKNFRSIGNMPLEIDYQDSLTTLIASDDNGSGKSNLAIWALYFALFNEPYSKDCKIGGLVNSKSGKDCLVELEFTTLGSNWLVKRGYKPALFEIWKDGKLLENEAANSEPQKFLQSIIGMDKKSFCNIVALGVERFVPFVQMGAPERRAFVEQMLDLIVISQMNTITKDKIKALRKQSEQITYETGLTESKLAGHQRTLSILQQKKQARLEESGSQLSALVAECDKYGKMYSLASDKLKVVLEQIDINGNKNLEQIKTMISRFNYRINFIRDPATKIEALHDCPTCRQGVSEAHKQLIREAAEAEVTRLQPALEKLQDELIAAQKVVDKNNELENEIRRIEKLQDQANTNHKNLAAQIKAIEAKMVDSNEDAQIDAEQEVIAVLAEEIAIKSKSLNDINKEEERHLQLLQILKDDGIKASIVAQYIPHLNQSINSILDRLNLYVQINIDSEFNVSMFSPDRKGQTIGNLSTGQLRRIDLAVLLSWREIAKAKASVDCNVLILDEILENLSASGVDEFMEMWESIGSDTNLIVISQRAAEFDQFFDRTIKYALKDGMTIQV